MELRTEKQSDDLHGKNVGVWLKGNDGDGMSIDWSKDREVILYGPRDDSQIKKMYAN